MRKREIADQWWHSRLIRLKVQVTYRLERGHRDQDLRPSAQGWEDASWITGG